MPMMCKSGGIDYWWNGLQYGERAEWKWEICCNEQELTLDVEI